MFDPSPRSTMVKKGGRYVQEKMVPEHLYKGYRPSIPASSVMPPLSGSSKGKEKVVDRSMPPPPLPVRRVSMWDAINDLMDGHPPAAHVTEQYTTPPEQAPSPRVFSPARVRRFKGKSKMGDPSLGSRVMAGSTCRWKAGIGYVCEFCRRVCNDPTTHHTAPDGNHCTDTAEGEETMPMFAGGVAFVPIEPEEHSEDERQVQPAMGLQMQSAISHQMQPHEEYHAQPHMQLQVPHQMEYPMQYPMQPQLQEQYPQMFASHYEHQQQQLFHDFDFQAAQEVHAQYQPGPAMEGVPPAWTGEALVEPAANAPEAYADLAQTGPM